MGYIGKRNHEGYLDLTAYEALKNIEREESIPQSLEKPRRRKRHRKKTKPKKKA